MPPPPPPRALRSVSPLSAGGPSSVNIINSSESNLPNNNLIIRPTTAGLLQFPTPAINYLSPEDANQQVNHSSSSRSVSLSPSLTGSGQAVDFGSSKFKDELLARQSKITGLNSVLPIEDRIKSNKQASSQEQQQKQRQTSPAMQMGSAHQDHVPNRLVSSLRKDKRPFAYSPGVNDPNNRGKLDLTQIKSPIMRMRLLANMNSTDDDDENDENEFNEEDEEVSNQEEKSKKNHTKPPKQPKILRFDPTPILGVSEKPGHIFIGGANLNKHNTTQDPEPEPYIQYHEPIVREQQQQQPRQQEQYQHKSSLQRHDSSRARVISNIQPPTPVIQYNEPPASWLVSSSVSLVLVDWPAMVAL